MFLLAFFLLEAAVGVFLYINRGQAEAITRKSLTTVFNDYSNKTDSRALVDEIQHDVSTHIALSNNNLTTRRYRVHYDDALTFLQTLSYCPIDVWQRRRRRKIKNAVIIYRMVRSWKFYLRKDDEQWRLFTIMLFRLVSSNVDFYFTQIIVYTLALTNSWIKKLINSFFLFCT